jgi:UDP-N-acetylmuramoyl-L-alanyl-D-glutamate--2,6-diaminopimelate ligase
MSMPAKNLNANVTLDQLLPGVPAVPAIPVGGIASDSRRLRQGDVFFACQGATSHGLDFIEQAIAAGVCAVVFDASTATAVEAPIPVIAVPELAKKIGAIANRWFDTPTSSLQVAGVTGTNGKTTVAFLIAQSLQLLDQRCAYIGTLGSGIGEISNGGYMTTPTCIELHDMFAEFRDQGAGFAAIEVSSHALQQNRVDGVKFDLAIFTNLSRDHIDYHGSMRAYGEAKASLFLDYAVENRIVNVDDAFGRELAKRCGPNVVTVATTAGEQPAGRPHISVSRIESRAHGYSVSFVSSWGNGSIRLPLVGKFNIANALDVLATLSCWGVSLESACAVLEKLSPPPGRMQRIDVSDEAALPAVYVDYSHTPASLEAALVALRAHCSGRLWCVFGCGGDRDRGKRPMMGEVASQNADFPVVTSDNPRTEDPAKIMAEILAGMDGETTAIEDRAAAIEYAVARAAAEDTVLIAGKGHEYYQIVGAQRIRFSDAESAAASLENRARREAAR